MMNRKEFIKKGLIRASAFFALPASLIAHTSCYNDTATKITNKEECDLSPRETAGPFPNRKPAELVKANIISDRVGVPLLINLQVLRKTDACTPLAGVFVDVWHCDSKGEYSEYGNSRMQSKNNREVHFLRGRQTTSSEGIVSFISIYPGWYRGRAPHIHVEVKDQDERSFMITQVAFPEDISNLVYKSSDYRGPQNVSNERDGVFRNSLAANMGEINGNIEDGYTINYKIVV